MERKINILVTDADYKHSLGIARALGKEGMKPLVLSNQMNSLCALSKYSKGEIVLPVDYSYEMFLSEMIKNKIDLIILVGTGSYKKILPWKEQLKSSGVGMVSADLETQEVAFSKVKTYEQAVKIGVPVPKTLYPQTFIEVENYSREVTYPCVIKGLYEVGNNIVDYAANAEDLLVKYKALCEDNFIEEGEDLPMLQEYISGFGCAFFAVYKDGVCGPTFQHKRIRELPVSGGASVCAESYSNPLIEKYGRLLLDSLSWNGVAMVEFKMNTEGEPILMEINPKFWGSTDLALEAGVNFPKYLVDIYKGKEVGYSDLYKYPFRYHWPFDGDIQHGLDNPKNLLSIFLDSINPKVRSNLWISDLRPTIRLFEGFVKVLIRKYLWAKNEV